MQPAARSPRWQCLAGIQPRCWHGSQNLKSGQLNSSPYLWKRNRNCRHIAALFAYSHGTFFTLFCAPMHHSPPYEDDAEEWLHELLNCHKPETGLQYRQENLQVLVLHHSSLRYWVWTYEGKHVHVSCHALGVQSFRTTSGFATHGFW